MVTVSATEARSHLCRLIDRVSAGPVRIAGKHGNAVLLSEADWRAIQETLYLLAIPGVPKSMKIGLKTPVARCKAALRW